MVSDMHRRAWPILLPAVAFAAGLAACSDGDDATATTTVTVVPADDAATTSSAPATTAAASTTGATTTPPSLTTPASVIADTEAVGGSSLSTVDLTTGTATTVGSIGAEIGVLGIAVASVSAIDAITDEPALLVLTPGALDAPDVATPVDAGGDTLLALARRPSDGALFAIGDSGVIVRIDPATGATTPVAEIALDDPGVGLDVTAAGALEVVVATGAWYAVDVDTGAVTDLPALTADEAPPRVVAVAHGPRGRIGIDAAADELVTIGDDGRIDTVGPLGLDVTDGASLDVGPDGIAVLANPG
jgi:hypothetical protein